MKNLRKGTVLITGGTGLLGKALIDAFRRDHHVLASYVGDYSMEDERHLRYVKLDILDFDGYKRLFQDFQPNIVIHTASIGSPDFSENNKEITWRINVSATENIVSLCNIYGARLVFISSNGIYDGEHAPYSEDDQAVPVNYYGKVKLEGEALVLASSAVSAIVRPNLMYGWHNPFERQNIVTLALNKLKNGETFMAYEDVHMTPLYVEECARAIFRIVAGEKYGVFNIAGAERVSVYELIKETARIFGLDDGLVKPVGQGYFDELVPRPRDTSFSTNKMETELMIRPLTVKEGLSIMERKRASFEQSEEILALNTALLRN